MFREETFSKKFYEELRTSRTLSIFLICERALIAQFRHEKASQFAGIFSPRFQTIQQGFTRERVSCHKVCPRVNPGVLKRNGIPYIGEFPKKIKGFSQFYRIFTYTKTTSSSILTNFPNRCKQFTYLPKS